MILRLVMSVVCYKVSLLRDMHLMSCSSGAFHRLHNVLREEIIIERERETILKSSLKSMI